METLQISKYWTSKVEVFENLTLEGLKEALNEFSKEHFVIATQTFPRNEWIGKRNWDAIVYYKIPPGDRNE